MLRKISIILLIISILGMVLAGFLLVKNKQEAGLTVPPGGSGPANP